MASPIWLTLAHAHTWSVTRRPLCGGRRFATAPTEIWEARPVPWHVVATARGCSARDWLEDQYVQRATIPEGPAATVGTAAGAADSDATG